MPKCYNQIYLKSKDITVDCGKCLNCLSNKAKEYGARMTHEADDYKSWYFFTFTYNNMELPFLNGKPSLNKIHVTNMIKRINKHVKSRLGQWKYFLAGEYGETTLRPHYHMVAFSTIPILQTVRDNWTYGEVDRQIAWSYKAISYTVGYSNKKIGFKTNRDVVQPFHKFSRGIGRKWMEDAVARQKINEEKYFIENQNYKMRIPAFYKKMLKESITGVKVKYLKKDPTSGENLVGHTYKIAIYPEMSNDEGRKHLKARLKKWEEYKERIKIRDEYKEQYWYYKNKYGTNSWNKNFDWIKYCEENELDYKKYDKVIANLVEKRNEQLKAEAINKYYSRKLRSAV